MLVMPDEADNDRKLQRTKRKMNTSILKIDYHEEPTEAGIERRDEVRMELVKFISLHTGDSEEDVISMIPPVHGEQPKIPFTLARGRHAVVPSIRLVVMKVTLRSQN